MNLENEGNSPQQIVLDAIFQKAKQRLDEIDNQILNHLSDKGPSLEFTPPGVTKSRQTGYKSEQIKQLEQQKELLLSEIQGTTKLILEISPKDLQKKYVYELDNLENLVRDKNDEKESKDLKDIDESQRQMNRMLAEEINQDKDPEISSGLSSVFKLHDYKENKNDIVIEPLAPDYDRDDY